jgi:hypothetical protein
MLAADRPHANAAEREDAGFDRRLADHLHRFGHIDTPVEIG